MLIPLHVKSHYSFGHATASLEALVDRAAAQGLPAFALTDRDTLAGQLHFHDLCRNRGIRPITGAELADEGSPAGHGRLLLLARDREGYRSLCRIISRRRAGAGSEAEQRSARDAVTAVADHPTGLFILTDDAALLERLIVLPQIDRSALRALLVRPERDGRGQQLLRVAARHRIALVADPEVVLLDRSDQPLYRLLAAIDRHVPLAQVQTAGEPALERWLRPPAAVEALFADAPQAVEEANRVASRCLLELEQPAPLVPGADAFGGRTPAAELARRCAAALEVAQGRGRCRETRYGERLEHELDVINRLGYAGYFLAAADIVDEANRRAIPVALRGSAAASLTVHLLGISKIDPLPRGLYFERFLHFGRQSPPDIDVDVCSHRRDELIRWCYRRFGRHRVALVGAYQSFRLASAFRYGLKALGASRAEIESFMAELAGRHVEEPATASDQDEQPGAEVEEREAGAEAGDLPLTLLSAAQRSAAPTLLRLVGIPRNLALHPGGLLIAEHALDDYVPVERASRNLTVAQYDLRSVERAGFTKLDLLGNRFLSQLAETTELVHARGGVAAPEAARALPASELPLDDQLTLERISRADTIGCFQIETPAMRALLEQLPVRRMEDVVAALALVRPGAGAGTAKRDYLRRVHGEPPAHRLHGPLAERLHETQGLLLYDEDLMEILSGVASISLAAADEIRSAIIDADAAELARLEESFLELTGRRGGDVVLARSAWRSIATFASYTFCKAHAWSYAMMAYQSAYLKAHHPLELGCALLNGYGGAYPLRTIAADLTRAGVVIMAPSVNRSALRTTIEGLNGSGAGAIRVGLDKLKHLTKKNAQMLLEQRRQRPFAEMTDLLARVPLSRREVRSLVLSGACDGLSPLAENNYPFAHEQYLEPRPPSRPATYGVASADSPQARAKLDRYRILVRMRNELELLGMHLADHPLRVLRDEARRYGCLSSAEIRSLPQPPRTAVRFAGVVAASRRHRRGTSSTPPVYFLTFEDEHGLLEAVIPPAGYFHLARQVTTPGPYLVEGKLTRDRGHAQLTVSALYPFHERARVPWEGLKHAHA